MSTGGLEILRRALRQVKNAFAPTALILVYHRVAQLASDPETLCVTPQHFDEHLEILRKHGRLLRLQELTRSLQHGNLPRRAVVVTFDDGYCDNLNNAKPLLERHGTPATVFVTAGYVGFTGEFWWDELDRILLQPGAVPERLSLSLDGRGYFWELGEAAHYAEEAFQRHRSWNVLMQEDPGPRQHLYRALYQLLLPLAETARRKVLDELIAWSGLGSLGRPTHRPLSSQELFHLVEGGLMEVGAHTMTHPILSKLPYAEQEAEIQGSKTRLEEILESAVTSFSYPYGYRSDFSADTVTMVRNAGFACACSTLADVVRPGADQFQLPRIAIRDWDGDTFARRLTAWFVA